MSRKRVGMRPPSRRTCQRVEVCLEHLGAPLRTRRTRFSLLEAPLAVCRLTLRRSGDLLYSMSQPLSLRFQTPSTLRLALHLALRTLGLGLQTPSALRLPLQLPPRLLGCRLLALQIRASRGQRLAKLGRLSLRLVHQPAKPLFDAALLLSGPALGLPGHREL